LFGTHNRFRRRLRRGVGIGFRDEGRPDVGKDHRNLELFDQRSGRDCDSAACKPDHRIDIIFLYQTANNSCRVAPPVISEDNFDVLPVDPTLVVYLFGREFGALT